MDYGPDVPPMAGIHTTAPMIAQGLAERFAAAGHYASNLVVRFDAADRATGVCHAFAWHRYRDGARDGELLGQDHHAFRRTPANWRTVRLQLRAAGAAGVHRARMRPLVRRGAAPRR